MPRNAGGGVDAGVRLLDLHPPTDDLCADVARGLSATPRAIPPKYFYDERGARLFERITELEAYYPTRTEMGILRDSMAEISERVGPRARVVEFGSGSGVKTEFLLEHLDAPVAYIPIDISRDQLVGFARRMAEKYPAIEILPVCADYTREMTLPDPSRDWDRTLAFFPGSTIGNFERERAEKFLRRIAEVAGPSGQLLIGIDLVKDPAIVERAYNDPEGVTAAFNLNLLERINRACGADFDVTAFRHRAVYDDTESRIEMRLVSQRDQRVRLGRDGVEVDFGAGEHIITEYSHKFSRDDVRAMAVRTGWRVMECWTDADEWFGVFLFGR